MRRGTFTLIWSLIACTSLWAQVIVHEDFQDGVTGTWFSAGTARHAENEGVLLVDEVTIAPATLTYGEPIDGTHLTVEARFTISPGGHGLGGREMVSLPRNIPPGKP